MSRGISTQQRRILAVTQAAADQMPLGPGGRYRRVVASAEILQALGAWTPSQRRSAQRALKGLADRGLLVAEKDGRALKYMTSAERERWDSAWGGADARAESFERMIAAGRAANG